MLLGVRLAAVWNRIICHLDQPLGVRIVAGVPKNDGGAKRNLLTPVDVHHHVGVSSRNDPDCSQ